MNATEPVATKAAPEKSTSRQVARRELVKTHFAAYPGWVQGERVGRVSAHSKMGGFVPRAERRRLARAFAAGEWRKRHVMAMAASMA